MTEAPHWLLFWPLEWLFVKPCPLCRQPLAPPGLSSRLCPGCADHLSLPRLGLSGTSPLGWWAAGLYQGAYRRLLLELRRHPHQERIAALIQGMERPTAPPLTSPQLVPVPSWKRRANPLPTLIGQQAARQWRWAKADLLERSRPVLGQHHLNQSMRQDNQRGSFSCLRRPSRMEARKHPVFLVDDILTTGATALNAAETLQQAGWRVQGLICLARTPLRRQVGGRDLRSQGAGNGTPG